jgi:predicted GNAT family N-acyltransferase
MSCTISLEINLIICIKDDEIRAHWAGIIGRYFDKNIKVEFVQIKKVQTYFVDKDDRIEKQIMKIFESNIDSACIFITDYLMNQDTNEARRLILKNLQGKFSNNLYASLVILEKAKRLPDIDLVLSSSCGSNDISDALNLLIARLAYFYRPPAQEFPKNLEIRRISTEQEFFESLELRYNVYNIMGYLEQDLLDMDIKLELTWCDTFSIHFGVFIKMESNLSKLIGTSRLILTHGDTSLGHDWVYAIAKTQPLLSRYLKRQKELLAQFRLPIFHTIPINSEMWHAFKPDARPWAELSRIVVAPNYRGCGISRKLIAATIEEAIKYDVEVILLECLEIHSKMYESLGFKRFNERGLVMGVGKTMVGMHQSYKETCLIAQTDK